MKWGVGDDMTVQLRWEGLHGLIAMIDGRWVRIPVENLLNDDPEFVVMPKYLTHWGDGTALTPEEKRMVLDEFVNEATRRGWKFEVDADGA